jgi:hypothetical protein
VGLTSALHLRFSCIIQPDYDAISTPASALHSEVALPVTCTDQSYIRLKFQRFRDRVVRPTTRLRVDEDGNRKRSDHGVSQANL